MIQSVNHEFNTVEWSTVAPIPTQGIHRIGLMADSHGNLEAIKNCIDRFQSFKVDIIIHLGDLLDSQNTQNIIQIIKTIQRHQIYTVKGNNDYQVENALKNGYFNHAPVHHQKLIQSFLSAIPMRQIMNNICFTHSLPYDSIRSIYEPVDTGNADRAERIFHDTDYPVIFSGHSHFPILFRSRSGKVSREPINSQSPVMLHGNERFIIVVGSVSEGEAGVMDIAQMRYERIRI
jgi:putative phosphoesterase